jgi:hypothetical protein
MASGRQVAHENLQRFTAWIASKTDEDYRALASRGVLSRKEIARECGFAKSMGYAGQCSRKCSMILNLGMRSPSTRRKDRSGPE